MGCNGPSRFMPQRPNLRTDPGDPHGLQSHLDMIGQDCVHHQTGHLSLKALGLVLRPCFGVHVLIIKFKLQLTFTFLDFQFSLNSSISTPPPHPVFFPFFHRIKMANRFFQAYGSSQNTSMMAVLDRNETSRRIRESEKRIKNTKLILKEDKETYKKTQNKKASHSYRHRWDSNP